MKIMETKDFFTTEFYEQPELTLEVLNRLVEGKHVADQDMYEGGEFLYMEVYENEDTKKIRPAYQSWRHIRLTIMNALYLTKRLK